MRGGEEWEKVTASFAADNKRLMTKVMEALRGTLGPQ